MGDSGTEIVMNGYLNLSTAVRVNFSDFTAINRSVLLSNFNSSAKNAPNAKFGDHSVATIVSLSLVYGLLSLTATIGNGVVIWIIRKYAENSPSGVEV